ncbi:hypothetical protein IFM89_001428 [Coptis chinensis]|uniref:Endonuclease/exonuclease/phosphatase n=1 Tax=Coptis chinensis TaxID=261450 RepID=A0A835LGM7_9MAGN|nr:hypothetical protein IFM89_001428 [Coptis chinensis]
MTIQFMKRMRDKWDDEQGFEDAVDLAQEFVMRTNIERDMGNMKDKEQESMSRALVVHDSPRGWYNGLVLALGVADVVVDHIDIREVNQETIGPIVALHNGFRESCFGIRKAYWKRGGCSAVHAACLIVQRRQLWAELENLMPNLPWLSDHMGLKYTWCNNQHGSGRILARLDRVFYNQAWIQKFGGWRYKVGSREGSDHAPLLGAVAHIPRPHNVPFRFNQAWTSHKEFKDFMKCSWPSFVEGSPIFRMNKKLRMLKESLKT